MHEQQQMPWRGRLVLIAFGAVVLAFMGLSLTITATGTARFAVAMGYRAEVGYAVGGVFDLAKALLPIALMLLRTWRAFRFMSLLGFAWLLLVTYSALATHATVSSAITAIERNGNWKMEGRANLKAELGGVEQRLAALSEPKVPRPSGALRAALRPRRSHRRLERQPGMLEHPRRQILPESLRQGPRVAPRTRGVRGLRGAESRASRLRQGLAAAPILATTDPCRRPSPPPSAAWCPWMAALGSRCCSPLSSRS